LGEASYHRHGDEVNEKACNRDIAEPSGGHFQNKAVITGMEMKSMRKPANRDIAESSGGHFQNKAACSKIPKKDFLDIYGDPSLLDISKMWGNLIGCI
jgi:hypothetical protein